MEQQEPVFNVPKVIFGLVLAMGLIHAGRVWLLGDRADFHLIEQFAFVPARLTLLFDPQGVARALREIALRGGDDIRIAALFFDDGSFQPWTLLTYAFLHADWLHYGLNSIWLLAFGAPVARRFGVMRFLALFFVTALTGILVHYMLHHFDPTPVIGASASVSGAMGAALRFVFQPGAPLGRALAMGRDEELAYRPPALPLGQCLRDRRVLTFIMFWFAMNFIFGIAAQPLGLSDGSVAWEAHVGGFLGGLLLFSWFDPKPRDFM